MAIVIKVSDDRMDAVAEVDRLTEEPIGLEALKQALTDARVAYGIDEAACNELVTAVNDGSVGLKHARRLAHGTPPVSGENGSFELAVDYSRNPVGTITDAGTVDFHDHGPFTPITQGQLIAHIALPTPGTPGKDVLGSEIKTVPGVKAAITSGAGTKFEAGGSELRATRNGDLRCSGDLIEVLDIIRVPGNIDYAVGNIDCEGPVRVEGDVLAGFHIRAGGDVYIAGVVDSAEVTAAGTITVSQGVLGGSIISARKGVKAGYLRDAYVESDENIFVAREILNSTIVCGNTITIADSGRVVGGRLFAQNRIETGSAGNEKGVPTALTAGVNPLQQLRAAKLNAEMERSRAVRKRVGKMREIATTKNQGVLDQLLARLTEKNAKNTQELEKLAAYKASLAGCRIRVRRDIHPGVTVRIGNDDLQVAHESRNVTFHYDDTAHQVVQVQGDKK
jgi:uncharacterized protein (DUF342 family)